MTRVFIQVLAASLWISEAMPAFTVGFLVIGLEVLLLGRTSGSEGAVFTDWEKYLATWGRPRIWLFFGRFVLARAAERAGSTKLFSQVILLRIGNRLVVLIAGCMSISFVFSMFISNTTLPR